MPLGIKPTVDFAFKKIFGSPENAEALIGLLNAILKLAHPITHVEILNPFSYQEFVDDKLIVLDIRACDSTGRYLNIEMQVSVNAGLMNRLVYYACSMYVDQLQEGDGYASLCPAISICLLNKELFNDAPHAQPHHRFRLVDVPSGRALPDGIEVHTVELTKYNMDERAISQFSSIEQWAFFLLYADQYDAHGLRELLPAIGFQQAITVIERIAAKTEDKQMYDQRKKAQRDHDWILSSVRAEGREEGREEGLAKGQLVGRIRLLQSLLDMPESSDLHKLPMEELATREQELQSQLRNRG